MVPSKICQRADESEPRNLGGFSLEARDVKALPVRRIYSSKVLIPAAGIIVLALSATAFYRVRELLAALLIFSVLFGVVGIAVLILLLIQQATHEGAAHLEAHRARNRAGHIVAPVQPHADHILRH